MGSLDIVVVPVHTTISYFYLLLSPAVVLSHQVVRTGIIVIIVV